MQGPGGDAALFSPKEFVETVCAAFPDSILSLGWRTKYQPGLFYTSDVIDAMRSAVAGVTGLITFAVRACYLRESLAVLRRLLDAPRHSFTLWNNEPLGPGLLQWIRENTDPKRCFYDLITP